MIRAFLFALIISLSGGLSASYGVEPDEILDNPVLEQRARDLSSELRCLVCQNQSIDDSDADLAKDLRLLVRERLTAGDSDDQVMDYVVARYGEFVLLRPVLAWHTLALWLAAPVVLMIGLIVALLAWRRRAKAQSTTPDSNQLTKQEAAALARLSSSDQ